MKRCLLLGLLLVLVAGVASAADDPLATLRPGHPRLLCTDDDLAAARAAAASDPLRAAVHARVIALAEAELSSKSVVHVLVGPRLLDQSRTCLRRVLTCAFAYRLTGDARFAERAVREMLTAARFPDWNPSHFLDVAEMATALAIGYDWLYSTLSDDDRATVRDALRRHALAFAPAAYGPPGATGAPTRSSDRRLHFVTAHHNWNQVCNTGLLAAALALADEEPDLARTVIAGARRSLPLAMKAYEPDGAYPEGPGYWTYGTSYNVLGIALLESALGTDLGLSQMPSFDRAALYRMHIEGPIGLAFNHADGGARIGPSPAYTWLATRYGHTTARAQSRASLAAVLGATKPEGENDRLAALHAIWFPTLPGTAAVGQAPLDVRFRGRVELAIFRSAWNQTNAVFLGFKAGSNEVNHAHLDLGSFVLDADGVRWSHDLGPDNYNLPAYFGAKRWSYYRLNNLSHSTLTLGDALQDPRAAAPLVRYLSTPERAHAVADLTAAYPKKSEKLLRGVALLDRQQVLVQDDIHGLAPGVTLTWRMLTEASVRIEEQGRVATLTQKGRTLRLDLLAPGAAVFTTRAARPPTSEERQNTGFSEVRIELPGAPQPSDVRVAVTLTPVGSAWRRPATPSSLPSLTAWSGELER